MTLVRLAVTLLAFLAAQASAQAVVSGTVKDSLGRALPLVEVSIEDSKWVTRSDTSGYYLLRANTGEHVLRFRLLGFAPVRRKVGLRFGEVVKLDAVLAAGDAQQLTAIEVLGPRPRGVGREAFAERRALGLGKFIDSTAMRRADGRRLSEMLPEIGLKIVQGKFATNPRRVNFDGSNKCYATVILDGVTIFRDIGERRERAPLVDLSRDFRPDQLESVEYYAGPAQTPMEFSGLGTECGVIVLWTRRN
jgi:hypothetical protein